MTGAALAPRSSTRVLIGRIARSLIPECEQRNLPGADDPAILDSACAKISARIPHVERLLEYAFAGFGDATDVARSDPAAFAAALASAREQTPHLFAQIVPAIVQSYFADPRVLEALGRSATPPFPRGNSLPASDWSLLDPVRQRGPIYRAV